MITRIIFMLEVICYTNVLTTLTTTANLNPCSFSKKAHKELRQTATKSLEFKFTVPYKNSLQ